MTTLAEATYDLLLEVDIIIYRIPSLNADQSPIYVNDKHRYCSSRGHAVTQAGRQAMRAYGLDRDTFELGLSPEYQRDTWASSVRVAIRDLSP